MRCAADQLIAYFSTPTLTDAVAQNMHNIGALRTVVGATNGQVASTIANHQGQLTRYREAIGVLRRAVGALTQPLADI